MEDVLELYAEAYDAKRPVVCFDETNKQLIEETRLPLPAPAAEKGHAAQVARYDYEIMNTGAMAHATCLCTVNPRRGGAMWPSPSNAPEWILRSR